MALVFGYFGFDKTGWNRIVIRKDENMGEKKKGKKKMTCRNKTDRKEDRNEEGWTEKWVYVWDDLWIDVWDVRKRDKRI